MMKSHLWKYAWTREEGVSCNPSLTFPSSFAPAKLLEFEAEVELVVVSIQVQVVSGGSNDISTFLT